MLARDPKALAQIADLLRGGATLVTGAARLAEPTPGDRRPHYFNSIQVIDRRGALLDSYDKIHLVPFGEYLPWADLFERLGVTQFVHIPGGFDAGAGPAVLHAAGPARRAPADLLRSDLSAGRRRAFRPDEQPPGLDAQRHQRRLVRADAGPLPAFRASAAAGHREGLPLVRAANGGISGGRRRPRPHHRRSFLWGWRACSTARCRRRARRLSQPIRGSRAAVDARGAVGCFGRRQSKAVKVIRLVVRVLALAMLAGAFAACVIDGARWIAAEQMEVHADRRDRVLGGSQQVAARCRIFIERHPSSCGIRSS